MVPTRGAEALVVGVTVPEEDRRALTAAVPVRLVRSVLGKVMRQHVIVGTRRSNMTLAIFRAAALEGVAIPKHRLAFAADAIVFLARRTFGDVMGQDEMVT
jgi:hypothetical protein